MTGSSSLYPDLRVQSKEGMLEKAPYFQFEEDETSSEILLNSGQEDSPTSALLLPQVLAVLAVSFGCFIHGTSYMYGAVALVGLMESSEKLKPNSTETELGFAFDNTQDGAWIIAIAAIALIFGSLTAAPVSNAVGRKVLAK